MTRPRPHHVEPLSQGRLAVLDLLAYAKTVPVIHGLLEVDVSRARERLAQREEHVTFTAFVVASVARAAARHPIVNTRRAGRKLVYLHPLDLVVTAEHREGDGSVPLPHVVHDAERRSLDDIAAELHSIRQRASGDDQRGRSRSPLERLPRLTRRLAVRTALRLPSTSARLGPAIGVNSLGMFGHGQAWGIPVSPLTLMVTVGSIGLRSQEADGAAPREVLALTLSFDHTVVDGAPAARFAADLQAVLEEGRVLDSP